MEVFLKFLNVYYVDTFRERFGFGSRYKNLSFTHTEIHDWLLDDTSHIKGHIYKKFSSMIIKF